MVHSTVKEVELDAVSSLTFFVQGIRKYKYFILAFSVLTMIASVFYAISLPNIYRSEAQLVPVTSSSNSGLSGMLNQLGGLASVAGISLDGGKGKDTYRIEESIKSRDFLIDFINKHKLKPYLFATKEWQQESNTLILDHEIYDKNNNWIRDVKYPKKKTPTDEEAYEKFREIFNVTYIRKKNLFKLSIDFYSPLIAQEWLSELIKDFNHYNRINELAEINRNLDFLKKYIETTELKEIQQTAFALIEEQMRALMLAKSKAEYTLETIQSAYIPEKKYSPSRALICIGLSVLGFILATVTFLIVYGLRLSKHSVK
ncbi:Wzz/FepE/Etk N-terminal domain-containing protein [Flocculibacter collagenilyticus]|uniref:Wzz/FepE/Etk N-terminal domain-containing protein n=1 Tax=Flocculibacter collagenilyticus TaxID=2744479 RepID=UPI0018F6AB81|nr:Wzz/FepE/Etk N-terminal domain-containing protein [Flocculibacter collagenilyticus]